MHHLVPFQLKVLIKLEPQLTQVGANKWFLPTVVTICLRRFEAEVNTFPHISQMKYFSFRFIGILSFFYARSFGGSVHPSHFQHCIFLPRCKVNIIHLPAFQAFILCYIKKLVLESCIRYKSMCLAP